MRVLGGPRSGSFPNLGVNSGNCQGNMPSGPVGASLGGLTPQAAQIQEVMAMLGNMSEGQLQTVQQHMQDHFVTMQQRRGVPEVFGDGLGRAADFVRFVTSAAIWMFCMVLVFNNQTVVEINKHWMSSPKVKMVDAGTNTSEYLEEQGSRGF